MLSGYRVSFDAWASQCERLDLNNLNLQGIDIEFVATLDHSKGTKYGFQVLHRKEGIQIRSIASEGLITDWNVQNRSMKIRKGHVIVDVNGVRGPNYTTKELDKLRVMTVTVQRKSDKFRQANVLASALPFHSILRHLGLARNSLGDVAMVAISEALGCCNV